MGDMHQPSRKKRSQRSKSRKSNTNSGSDSSYNKCEKSPAAKKDDLLPVRYRLPTSNYNDPGLPPMPPIRGPSSYNGVRSGSFNSFGVSQYAVPGLTFPSCDGTTPYNQGHYESASIYLPYQIQDTNTIFNNKDGKGRTSIRVSYLQLFHQAPPYKSTVIPADLGSVTVKVW